MSKIFRIADWPISTKLMVAFMVLGLVAALSIGVPEAWITRVFTANDTQQKLQTLAELQSDHIGQELYNEVNLIETALVNKDNMRLSTAEQNASYSGTQEGIVDSILALDEEWQSQPTESNPLINGVLNNALGDELRAFIEENPEHLEAFVTDQYGATVAATGVLSDYYQADEEWWQVAWNNGAGGIYIGPVVYDESAGAPIIEFAMPIRDASGKPIGVLKDAYSVAALQSRIAEFTLGETGQAHLFDGSGNLLAAPGVAPELAGRPAEETLLLGGQIYEGAGSALDVESENKAYVAGYAPVTAPGDASYINDLNWVVMILQEQSEAFKTMNDQMVLAIFVFIAAALTGAGTGVLISRYLTRSVNELEKVFRQAAIGNFEARAKIYGDDEIGRAADAVNHMLEQFTSLLDRISKTSQQRFDDFAAFGEAWELDAEGRYVFTSESFAETLGYEATEMLGRHAAEFVREDNVAVVGAEIERSTRELTPTKDYEVIYQTKDGQDLNILVSGRTVIDENGKVTGYRGIHKNITERRQAEIALRENQALLNSILQQVPDAIYVKDTNYRYVVVNEPFLQMTNRPQEDLIGKTDEEVGFAEDPMQGPAEREQIRQQAISDRAVIEEGRTIHVPDFEVASPDGTPLVIEMTKLPFYDGEGNIIGLIGSLRDVTAQRKVVHDVEAAAEQVTAATESMFDIVQLMLDQASTTAEMASDAAKDAEIGDTAVNNTVTAMLKIRDNTQESARRIKRLGESAQEITEAVRLIEEIADRTTVLALNASIQAAAAGEAGRGFAVVAEEVQRLAERATGATRQIEETVKGIQAGTNEAVFSIEEATRDVVEGSELARESGAAMDKLNNAITHLAALVQHMTETTASQTSESLGMLTNLSHELQDSVSGFRDGDSLAKGNGRETPAPALSRS